MKISNFYVTIISINYNLYERLDLNLPINLDNNLSERKLGNLKELGEFMKDKNTRDPSQEQLLDRKFKKLYIELKISNFYVTIISINYNFIL